MIRPPPRSTLFPSTPLFRSARLELDERLAGSALGDAPVVVCDAVSGRGLDDVRAGLDAVLAAAPEPMDRDRPRLWLDRVLDRESTRLNSSHSQNSYARFCLK